ncbi:hypothetical protein T484DRAFT_2388857 [Baffinella frigidus]|nr:hypothetical protein T484DRAFT_2388857 [Cryptophyta sp. CCMP2293]
MEGVCRVCGGCMEGVWRVCVGCVEGVWRVCGGCVEGVWRVYGGCVDGGWRVCGGCVEGVWRVYGGCVEIQDGGGLATCRIGRVDEPRNLCAAPPLEQWLQRRRHLLLNETRCINYGSRPTCG